MAIGNLLQNGERALDQDHLDEAVFNANQALKENENSFKALYLRNRAYLRSKKYDLAIDDASKLVTVAQNSGKREDIALALRQKGVSLFRVSQNESAYEHISQSEKLNPKDQETLMLKKMIENRLKKQGTQTLPESVPQEIHSPKTQESKQNLKVDWYDSKELVSISIFVKNIPSESLKVEFSEHSVDVSFKTKDSSEFNYSLDPLYGPIDPEKSSFKLFGTKLELYLSKNSESTWKSLEKTGEDSSFSQIPKDDFSSSTLSYPSSSRKKINWDQLNIDDDNEYSDQNPDDFFKKLYQNADEDTKRAMMKSYLESNGTALSTDWSEVGQKKVDTTPPDGAEVKKW
ncbi:hypothetical protein OGAPHI_002900 [Ogataea philodendri]|uniref:Protein SGT1 n=1 Tax=Ogataea philodendri TaxID=1378263 RepID=A0A9P8T6T3_9ASCO|nr:uncharacterized protein OGAPHI_002900 [Ogataea philodendri]KAH3667251.1 hypothetical protein OGAPHI_002900 [Ogataea philodendri]